MRMDGSFTDGQVLFGTRSGSSDSSSLQLQAGTTVSITVPAGNPTGGRSGKLSRDLFQSGTSDGGKLESSVGAGSNSSVTRNSVGEDGELMSSSEGGQDGEKGSRRRDHCCVWVVVLILPTRMSMSIYR